MRLPKIICMVLLLSMTSVYGQPQADQNAAHGRDLGAAEDGVLGVVVNQTVSNTGNEFYKIFSLLWSERPDYGNYPLNIKERLSKRYGNFVDIYLGQQRVYSAALPLKYDSLKTLCEKAVEETQTNIVTLSLQTPDSKDIVRIEM
jgi:hypothetical protein